MTAFLVRRLGQAILVILIVTVVVFILLQILPGGPARALLGPRASAAQIHAFIVANGYNRPLYIQYVAYLGRLVQGNLGFSYHYDQSVASLMASNLPKSVVLVGLAYFFGLLIAIPIGLLQAVKRNQLSDYVFTGSALLGYSIPTFWLGILLIVAFAVHLHLLPAEGPQGASVTAVISDPAGLVLPVATLTVGTVAWFSRYVRSAAIQNLVEDYVRTARASGISQRRILLRHVLPNSLLPLITLVGLSLPSTVAGAIVTESVFNYPGMGLLFWTATITKDFPVLMGCIIVISIATVAGSLLADVLYAVADPRIRYV